MELGQWVEFSTHLKRRGLFFGKGVKGVWRKEWVPESIPVTQGIVVGIRHLTNGENRLADAGVIYTHKEFITAYLVSVDLKHKHKLVLIKDAKELK